ncbi:hypothetical protein BBK36DRAFT_1128795 [Trichoderma citrinoviride]|uniref:Uncharacterized protein n=1 Tax=Trichoderma citrinoviride TaxID=58853 RepID=A0A2T4AZS7_9HYPO|nr:hypothetical protein BBK36DRAFT_1128795 [Trichoderma citrinoviride]PTB62574.1 hypothetical protein BBK36DRAFT_1128795 [Trichoderma citrinoviride]
METSFNDPFIKSWSSTPIPNLSLSAGGLLALADLNTIAQRTAIAGGSSWLDAFVLAPGLHYQQAADLLTPEYNGAGGGASKLVLSTLDGKKTRLVVSNVGMVKYLRRLWEREGRYGVVTLYGDGAEGDVGSGRRRRQRRWLRDLRRAKLVEEGDRRKRGKVREVLEMDWVSHVLYLLSPLLTVGAIVLMVLLQDWWGLGFLLALMASRLANIWAIKARSKPGSFPIAFKREDSQMTEYTIDWGDNRRVILKGQDADLRAVTTEAWLRAKTTLEGYLEAMSKLIVYMVASLSGNLSQAGAVVLMALLLVSAGLLGLSNAHATSLRMHGRRVGRLRRVGGGGGGGGGGGWRVRPLEPGMAVVGDVGGGVVPVQVVPVGN